MRQAALTFLLCLSLAGKVFAQAVSCAPNSPERVGKPGCSILGDVRLPGSVRGPVFWHIDEFGSLAGAQSAAGAASVAFSAHGAYWLATVETDTLRHHGGRHRATIGPIPLQAGTRYSMQVMSAYMLPGQMSTIHTHSGPEVWYVLEGEQCLQTTTGTVKAHAGQGAMVAGGDTMRLVVTGSTARRSLVLVLHDSERPASSIIDSLIEMRSCQ